MHVRGGHAAGQMRERGDYGEMPEKKIRFASDTLADDVKSTG